MTVANRGGQPEFPGSTRGRSSATTALGIPAAAPARARRSRADKVAPVQPDVIDIMIEQWGRERPDLDVSPVAVIGRVSRICRSFERAIQKTFVQYGLNSAAFYVLAALRRSGPPYSMSPTQLHQSLLISGGAMTHRIDRLEAEGLVTRVADPDDRRRAIVALTDRGRRLTDEILEVHNEHEHALLTPLSPLEREKLAALLRKLLGGSP